MSCTAPRSAGPWRKTYLIAFLDDATRAIPFAAFAFSENGTAFLRVQERAIRRGCMRLFVDNGAIAPSNSPWCAPSSMSPSSTPVPISRPERKIERWFRTLRAAWLARLDTNATESLEALVAASGHGDRGRVPPIPFAALMAARPSTSGRSPARTCATPNPPQTSTTSSSSRSKRRVMKDRTVSLHETLRGDALLDRTHRTFDTTPMHRRSSH